MVRAAALIVGLTLATSAQAQTVVCNRLGDQTVCQQQPTIQWPTPAPAPDYPPYRFRPPGQSFRDTYDQIGRIQADRTRQEVGRAIQAGRCDQAKNLALSAGDLSLAEQVQRICSQ